METCGWCGAVDKPKHKCDMDQCVGCGAVYPFLFGEFHTCPEKETPDGTEAEAEAEARVEDG